MKQLCETKINTGEYDSILAGLIKQDFKDETILREMMICTKGSENPATIKNRITMLRKTMSDDPLVNPRADTI